MSDPTITVEEKLAEVDRIVSEMGFRERRAEGGVCDRDCRTREVLKAVAADLRGRLDAAPSAAATTIQRRIDSLYRSRTVLGYDRDGLVGLGQELIGRWPIIKQALEKI